MPHKTGKTWYASVRYNGKQIKHKIGASKAKAEEAESRIRIQIAEGTFVPPKERIVQEVMTFEKYVTGTYIPFSNSTNSPTTQLRCLGILKNHLMPYFGKMPIDQITKADVKAFRQKRQMGKHTRKGWKTEDGKKRFKGVTDNTINREISVLSAIFTQALEDEIVEDSPVHRLKGLKVEKKAPEILTAAQIIALLDSVPQKHKGIIALAAYAGLRATEIFQIQWRDIDFENSVVTVTPGDDKSVKSGIFRKIPMRPSLVDILEAHRRAPSFKAKVISAAFGDRLVFPNPQGKSYKTINKTLNKAAIDLDIPKIRLHQLRHTFGSLALMNGADVRTVSKWMGHANLVTTMRYLHTSEEHERQVMNGFG